MIAISSLLGYLWRDWLNPEYVSDPNSVGLGATKPVRRQFLENRCMRRFCRWPRGTALIPAKARRRNADAARQR